MSFNYVENVATYWNPHNGEPVNDAEEKVIRALVDGLPDDHTVIPSISLPYHQRRDEADRYPCGATGEPGSLSSGGNEQVPETWCGAIAHQVGVLSTVTQALIHALLQALVYQSPPCLVAAPGGRTSLDL